MFHPWMIPSDDLMDGGFVPLVIPTYCAMMIYDAYKDGDKQGWGFYLTCSVMMPSVEVILDDDSRLRHLSWQQGMT
ncbi:Uncharacterized protein TCM_017969 [Theobroma cacao]|uniref:Uncharacterized protein n=1 Tax=Theobroma cacao TaxID=3641 RepID=A0A061EF69_THECC|nr:Uncharacterized protein TCM_017969 [Theobroma cacao]